MIRKIRSDDEVIWNCEYCGKENSVWVDFTIGEKQEFIEDCSVCCRPNQIIINIDDEDNISSQVKTLDE